jgi:hypothetical protein
MCSTRPATSLMIVAKPPLSASCAGDSRTRMRKPSDSSST